jgi:CelD/BcsL family acetyltransferase involved in cellulose biosynthesis
VRFGGVEVIEGVAREWRSLCESSAYADPFFRPEWAAAYVRAFAPQGSIALATVRLDRGLVAALPLVREFKRFSGVPARTLRGTTNAHGCRYDIVHRADASAAAIPALWNALWTTPGWDVLEFPNVPEGSGVEKLARHAQAHGCLVHALPAPDVPYLRFSDCSAPFETLLARLDSKFRANLRRRRRKLEELGAVRLIESREPDERLAQFYALEGSGWKGQEQSAIASRDATRRFYDDIARDAARFGALSIYALECGGRPAAMYLGVRQGTRYFLLKTAYDEALRHCSPGQLITHEVLRVLAEEHCSEFDFLGQLMDWKKDWLPQLRRQATWYFFRGTAGRLLHDVHFRFRPALGRLCKAGVPHALLARWQA